MSKNGGSAFPEIETDLSYNRDESKYFEHTYSYGGMTLRDYFAAQALVECIRVAADQTLGTDPLLSDLFGKASTYAYFAADAMLKERNK